MHGETETLPPLPAEPSWSEFAETFFEAEEDRKHDAFLARNAIRLMEASELVTVESRFVQSAIPEICDGCLLAIRTEEGRWGEVVTAHRYEQDTPSFHRLKRIPTGLREELLSASELRDLRAQELQDLQALVPSLTQGAVLPLGHQKGFVLFLQTRSDRAFTPAVFRLIRDLGAYGEQALFQAKGTESLRHEVREREKFISIAGHELRTPLTTLRIQLETLRRNFHRDGDALPAEKIEHSLSALERSIDRLDQSIGMLFNLSEIRTGQISIVREPGDLAALVGDVVERLEPAMARSRCQLSTEIPPELPAFFDARRIEQAILNLLANAAKYAPQSKVEVTVSLPDEQTAKIIVRDHGPGIPLESQAGIFSAFRRGPGRGNVEGLGLGLFVTEGVVRAHGGKLSMKSAPGEGATFEIEIPRWQA